MSDDTGSAPDLAEREIRRFLHKEARLIDEGRFEDWLALFAEDGVYWIPSQPGQTDVRTTPSILYEDVPLLAIRVRRLMHPRVYAAEPARRTLHIVGNVDVLDHEDSRQRYRVGSNLLVVEHQGNGKTLHAGRCEHILRRTPGGWHIVLKRVDLIDCNSVHGIMTIPL